MVPVLLALAAFGALTGCKGTVPTLQGAVDGLSESMKDLLGAPTLPGKYVQRIYAVHEDDRTWRFVPEADHPLETCREAIRGLAVADYGSWRESASVTTLLTAMADEHPSALVRAEALDSLTRMAPWTSAAVAPTERRATDGEAVAAIQKISDAHKLSADDAGAAADVADALNVLAAFRFDQANPLPQKIEPRILARESRKQLSTARGVLRALTGGAVDAFDADPRVREALDRALVATSASAIRMSLVAAASGSSEEIVRSAAVRDIAQAQPSQAARILGSVLANDDASSVRRDAARALQSFPEAEAVPELLPALADDRIEVRATAAASLGAVTGQTFGDDRLAWGRWWTTRSKAGAADAPASGGARK